MTITCTHCTAIVGRLHDMLDYYQQVGDKLRLDGHRLPPDHPERGPFLEAASNALGIADELRDVLGEEDRQADEPVAQYVVRQHPTDHGHRMLIEVKADPSFWASIATDGPYFYIQINAPLSSDLDGQDGHEAIPAAMQQVAAKLTALAAAIDAESEQWEGEAHA